MIINDLKGNSILNNMRKSSNVSTAATEKRAKHLALRRSNSEQSIVKPPPPPPVASPSPTVIPLSRVPPVIVDEVEELKAAPWYQPGLSRYAETYALIH